MVSLFLKGTTNFNNNGYVLNEWLKDSLKITENTDGVFDLDGEYPVQDKKNFSQYLVRGNIIRSPVYDSRPDQLFRIRKVIIDSSNTKITVYAQAIARCDLMNDFVFGGGNNPIVPAGQTRKQAIALILANCQDNNSIYHVGNLDTNTNTNINLGTDENTGALINYIDVAYVSPLTGILDNSSNAKSVYNAYGGEIIYNNFEINMVDERGTDNEFTIKSGKNLQEFQQEIDDTSDDFATVLITKSSDCIYLPNNEVITSPNVEILGKKYKVINCDDVTAADDSIAALNVVYDQLRERGNNKFTGNNRVDQLSINNTVKFAQLKKTEQYKNYAILEKCELGNNVTIIYKKLNNYTVTARVTQIVYNPLALNGQGKITEVTVGNRKQASIVNTVNSTSTTTTNNTSSIGITNSVVKKNKVIAKDYTDTRESAVRADIKVTTDSITLEVQNNKKETDTAIEIMDGQIQDRVKKGDFGSYITQNYDSVTEAIIDATGSHTCTFNGSGLTIENGGFVLKNSNGNIVFYVSTGGYCKLEDLQLGDTALAKGSYFYNALRNMVETSIRNLVVEDKLQIDNDSFEITIGGNTYNFWNAVKHVMSS